ncbi:hypothetical protein [Noviherbaspirillum sp.]|uniref:hypothetical protein n=1 Tax=Noviherbaspirillum sp. TaxID=1926288 RepID=UPI002FE0CC08
MTVATPRSKQPRKAPAYQEYASDRLANKEFRMMSLEERGLLFTLELELWHNVNLPADEASLSKLLGLDPITLAAAFSAPVRSFLRIQDQQITCPELDRQRDEQAFRRQRQSEGGRQSAGKLWSERDPKTIDMFDTDEGLAHLQTKLLAPEMRGVENSVQITYSSSNQSAPALANTHFGKETA